MPNVIKFTVVPRLPEKLCALMGIAQNYCWCWDPEAIALFFRIDPDRWVECNQNPVRLLGEVTQARLQELASDDSFLAHLERVSVRMNEYLGSSPWQEKHPETPDGCQIAYFSAEFGIHESLSIYSGGLGLLAGDHLKSASDLGLPLVGVGLLYREGYHRQYLNADGWPQEQYPRNDFYNLAVSLVRGDDGAPVVVEVPFPERNVYVRIWRVLVGRITLYLLDCDFDQNEQDDREITARLYGGDKDMRIRQEILLGMGGVRVLHTLGIWPSVFHMNEGHAAFLTLERIRHLVGEDKVELAHAIESVKSGSVFTTHTPVPAGNDMFEPEMVEYYFGNYAQTVGISMHDLFALGRQDPNDPHEPFCMTVLALKLSASANGVSKLHGHVARSMWARTWPGVPTDEIPITSITNGIHTPFWVSRDLAGLYDRYLGPGWTQNPSDPAVWERIDSVPDSELWRTHERRRERLVDFARRRLVSQLKRRGGAHTEINAAREALDPELLTIGFARRFATYKRANLLFTDPDRLLRLLGDPKRPVQMIFAGKAHPADLQAKELIRNVIRFIREHDMRSRILFIEDYDVNVARYMVQGVDCWLNTPRRPLEASGTSGMKVSANGGLNISIVDGWWCEAERRGENGWSIGRGEEYENSDEQDYIESEALYELLEREVVPTFYERGRDGLPREWIRLMKNAIKTICPVFNTHRMVEEYAERFYLPCTVRGGFLRSDNHRRAAGLAEWKKRIRASWGEVRILDVQSGPTEGLEFGSELTVTATVHLAGLTENDVTAEIHFGDLDPYGRIVEGRAVEMECRGPSTDGSCLFEGALVCQKTGQQGLAIRVIPSHPDLAQKHETALITWA